MSEASQLRNRYHLMRHGESLANQAGLIVSKPENGLKPEYGLSERGREEVRQSALNSELSSRAIIYSSPFSRAVQTTAILAREIGATDIRVNRLLSERNFGKWELTPTDNYQNIWEADATLSDETFWQSHLRQWRVEFPAAVAQRACRVVAMAEYNYKDQDVVFVSHGDTLQILQAAFEDVEPHQHRQLPPIETAEIRRVN